MASVNVAVLQSACRPNNPAGRLADLKATLDGPAKGADLLLTPELFLSGYNVGAAIHDLAEARDGPSISAARDLAARAGTALILSYPERDGGDLYNAAAIIGADGALLASYRKLHLIGDYERGAFRTGGGLAVTDVPLTGERVIRVAPLICYDIEFPEAARAAALAGADLIAVPTALRRQYRHVAEKLIPTRAFENGLFLAYANHAGEEGSWTYCGLSCVVGPDGHDIARAGDAPEVLRAGIDLAAIAAARAELPYLTDRRPDLN